MLIAVSQSQNFSLGGLFEVLQVSLPMLLRKTSDILNASRIRPRENPPLALLASTRGRPAYIIAKEVIEQLGETGVNWRNIATCLGISEQTLYRHGTDFETDNNVVVPESQIQLTDHQVQELQNRIDPLSGDGNLTEPMITVICHVSFIRMKNLSPDIDVVVVFKASLQEVDKYHDT